LAGLAFCVAQVTTATSPSFGTSPKIMRKVSACHELAFKAASREDFKGLCSILLAFHLRLDRFIPHTATNGFNSLLILTNAITQVSKSPERP
jgi:hypothetical protein